MNNLVHTKSRLFGGGACAKLCLAVLIIGTLIKIFNEAGISVSITLQRIRIRGGGLARASHDHDHYLYHDHDHDEPTRTRDINTAYLTGGPLLFDRSTGWNGTTPQDGMSFCKHQGSSQRSLCPWKAYCPGRWKDGGVVGPGPLGGLLLLNSNNNSSSKAAISYAPIASSGQPVWVSLSSGEQSCSLMGNTNEINEANVEYVLCCHDGEEEIAAGIGAETRGSLTIYESKCRNECHLSKNANGGRGSADNDPYSTTTIPQQYCLLVCRSMHHKKTMADIAHFFVTLPKYETDLSKEYSECLERCQIKDDANFREKEGSILRLLPSPTRQYCTIRCRWIYRQKAVSRLAIDGLARNPHESNSSNIIASERCDDMSEKLHYDGLCSSVSHRQKPLINLILSSSISHNNWLRKEYDTGMRDCPASQCHVMAGIGHTDSSHLYVGTDPPKETTMNATQVNVLVSKRMKSGKQEDIGVAWLTSSSHQHDSKKSRRLLMCDMCDKYAEEVLPNSKRSWDRSLDLEPMTPCMIDLFSRHTIPGPDSLPLINPVLGFDAIFVTNYTPLKERKKAMLKRVRDQFGIEPIFLSDFDREALSDEDLNCIGDTDGQHAYIHKRMSPGEYSLTLKHYAVYYYMVQHSLNNVIIMEDDGSFDNSDWISNDSLWQEHITNLPPDYDILNLCGVENTFKSGQKITEHMFLGQHSRGLDMYLASQKGARNMLRSLPVVSTIDTHMNYAAKATGENWWTKMPGHEPHTIDMKIYHVEPPMSTQREPNGTIQTISTYGPNGRENDAS